MQIVVVSRLRPEARDVYIGNINFPQISEKSIGESLEFSQGLTLTGQKHKLQKNPDREIRERLEFLVNVGFELSFPFVLAETLSGGEAQRYPSYESDWCRLSWRHVCIG